MKLSGKTALLTGATGGIGKHIAIALAAEGVKVILSGRNQQGLDLVAAKMLGTNHRCFAADLTDNNCRQKLAEFAIYEGVDLLINAAGSNQLSLIEDINDKELHNILNLNLFTPMALCKDLVPFLSGQKNSAIVNVGSTLGSIGFAGSTSYCATKFGLRGFTEALRRELSGRIAVIYFAPRATNTSLNSSAMQAMNRELGTAVDQPEAVAAALIQNLKRAAPHNHYLGWPEAFFVRLNSLFPKLVDRALLKKLPIIKRYAQVTSEK